MDNQSIVRFGSGPGTAAFRQLGKGGLLLNIS